MMLINSVGMLLNQIRDLHKKKEHYWLVINSDGTWHFSNDVEGVGDSYSIGSNDVGRIYNFVKSLGLAYANELELWFWVIEIIEIVVDDFYYVHSGEHIRIDWVKELRHDKK